MKIVLPKTLAEPLTIPWTDIISTNDVSEIHIAYALHRLIDNFERREAMPKNSNSPTEGVRTMLRITAEDAGADNAMATCYPIIECKTHAGYEYVVLFSLPNSKSLYNWSRKSWFQLVSVMYPS